MMDELIGDSLDHKGENKPRGFPVFVISGGVGTSGEQLARTVLAQFPDSEITIRIFPKIFTTNQVQQILDNALSAGAVVAHTFVDPSLRQFVKKYSQYVNVVSIDLIGPLMETLSVKLDLKPLGKPGMYRELFKSYFDRIDAMDYALAHDDGKNPGGWKNAEIVLLGASRVGKTPLSLYLSVLGWKVANIPLVVGIKPKDTLFEINQSRVIGLTIAPSELIEHRKHRQRQLGVIRTNAEYIDPAKVFSELEDIESFFRRNKISFINVTGKPIETSADEIIRLVRKNIKRDGD
jgi:regulator of PEP synthase PpsR (kinase-PPPase family)